VDEARANKNRHDRLKKRFKRRISFNQAKMELTHGNNPLRIYVRFDGGMLSRSLGGHTLHEPESI
jgi:hypothetical protein